MARKFSAFTNNPSRVPLDTLVGLDISAAAAAQNTYWSLNTLFSEITGNITDGALRFGGFAAPAVSAAGKGAIYFDSTSNTFKASRNTGAFADLIQGTIANTQVAVGTAAGTIAGSASFVFSAGVASIASTASTCGVVATNTAAGETGFYANQTVSGAASFAYHLMQTPSTSAILQLTTAGYTPANLIKANQLRLYGGTGTVETLFEIADASTAFVFGVNNAAIASINATASESLVLGVASSLTGRVKMFNSAGATYTQLSAGNAAASLNYILPATSPSAGYVLSASAPSGSNVTLSWAAAASAASLTATQVGFGDGTNMLSGSADFTYITATGRMGIAKTVNNSMYMAVTNSSNGTAAQSQFTALADVATASLTAYSSGFTTSGLITANTSLLLLDAPNALIQGQTGQTLTFALGNTAHVALTGATLAVTVDPTTGSGLNVTSATVSSGQLVNIAASGTAAAGNTKTGLRISTSGANGTASQTTFGAVISNTSTGTTNTNVALQLTASGGATANTALSVAAGAIVQASNLAAAFVSGPNGATNPTFLLNNSTSSAATGVSITSAAAGSGVTLEAISSGTNEGITIAGKGTTGVTLGSSSQSGSSTLLLTSTFGTAAFSVGGGGACAINSVTIVSGSVALLSAGTLSWNSDAFIHRNAAASLALGAADAAAPVAQSLGVQNVVAGTSNTAGVNWTFIGSRGTGTGAGGNLIWQVAPAAGSGSTQNTLINGLVLTSTGQLYGAALHNNSAAITGTTNQYIASGTYTPTVTAETNCDSAADLGVCQYIRVGNVVTVSGEVTVDPTNATTLTQVGISLPVASNFVGNNECCGTAAAPAVTGYSGAILADTTNDRAQLNFTTSVDVASRAWVFTFTYLIS